MTSVIRARVDSAISLVQRQVPPKMLDRLYAGLTFENPAYQQRRRLGRFAGAEPETICVAEECDGQVRIPRGAVSLLREVAADQGVSIAYDDRRMLPQVQLAQPNKALSLRNYQADLVEKLARAMQGVGVLPCGGGKTTSGMGAIAKLRTPTLILVHTVDLADQWISELRAKLGIAAGFIGDGREEPAPITVAIVQALIRWDASRLDSFLARFGLLIVDEAHHCPSTMFRGVIGRCPAKYRLGLTATPERADGLGRLLDFYFGPPLKVVTHEELRAAGVLSAASVRAVETDFDYPYLDAGDYAPMLAALAHNSARNTLMVGEVVREARAGNVCLVLSGRVDHCQFLRDAIVAQGVRAEVLTSQVKRQDRKALLDAAREGRMPVLVATSLADEGLDVPRLSRVFLAFPAKSAGRTTQRLGRLMRPHPSKRDSVLVDFVDSKVPLLRRHYLDRRRSYAEVLGTAVPRIDARRVA